MNTINESKVRTFPFYKDENYTVYEDGRMYSHITNKFLKPTITNKKQALYGKHGSIAHIVWQSVHGELDDRTVVSFKDGDTTNYALSNLYIRTYSEMNSSNHTIGSRQYPSMLLDDKKIQFLLEGIKNNVSLADIAKELDCCSGHLRAILMGRAVKWFYDKYGPFDYYEPIRKTHEMTGKYVGMNKKKSQCYTPYKHKHGSRKPAVIKELCFGLKSAVCKINNIADIKHQFNISTYQAVKLKQCVKGDKA
jgi:hypothetical protein